MGLWKLLFSLIVVCNGVHCSASPLLQEGENSEARVRKINPSTQWLPENSQLSEIENSQLSDIENSQLSDIENSQLSQLSDSITNVKSAEAGEGHAVSLFSSPIYGIGLSLVVLTLVGLFSGLIGRSLIAAKTSNNMKQLAGLIWGHKIELALVGVIAIAITVMQYKRSASLWEEDGICTMKHLREGFMDGARTQEEKDAFEKFAIADVDTILLPKKMFDVKAEEQAKNAIHLMYSEKFKVKEGRNDTPERLESAKLLGGYLAEFALAFAKLEHVQQFYMTGEITGLCFDQEGPSFDKLAGQMETLLDNMMTLLYADEKYRDKFDTDGFQDVLESTNDVVRGELGELKTLENARGIPLDVRFGLRRMYLTRLFAMLTTSVDSSKAILNQF